MPSKPQSRCPTCTQLHLGTGTCPRCKAKADTRPTAAARGYNRQHRNTFRRLVLERDPICVICHQAPSTHADHWPQARHELVEQGLDPNNPTYGRGLCAPCDSRQTAQRQPGGFNTRTNPEKIRHTQ